MNTSEKLSFKNREEWRYWLRNHHQSKKEVWLIYYKKHTGQASISYSDAVEEAICFGWIDGQIKKIDDEKYMQRYTPRTLKSLWSELNIERAKKMIKLGQMTEIGFKVYSEGMKSNERVPSSKNFSIPPYFETAIIKNQLAWNNFQNFAPSAQLAYVYWVNAAKTEETRQKRIKRTIEQLERNKKFGEI